MPTEIEMRARFDQHTHDTLAAWLAGHGHDLGQDDKRIYFYVLADKLIKVVHNITRADAKLVLKTERIGRGSSFPEVEVAIAPGEVANAVAFFNGLGLENTMHEAYNRRRNYRYQGVEIALKWSEAWGYHAEFEVLLGAEQPEPDEVAAAEARIHAVAENLGITLMSEQELLAFTQQFEQSVHTPSESGHASTSGTGE